MTTPAAVVSLNLELATKVADELAAVVKFKKKQGVEIVKDIEGKKYPLIPCWQIVGAQLQVYPRVESVEPSDPLVLEEAFTAGKLAVRAVVNLYTFAGVLVGSGVAVVSQSERNRSGPRWKDAFAMVSMAQTRAEAKAYRNSFGWVIQLAGFEATPAEEMDAVRGVENVPTHAEPELLDDKMVKAIMTQPLSADDGTRLVSEDECRAFVWTVACLITENPDEREPLVRSWGAFESKKDGRTVPGPLPWETKNDGSLKMAGKWLNIIVDRAKEALANTGY